MNWLISLGAIVFFIAGCSKKDPVPSPPPPVPKPLKLLSAQINGSNMAISSSATPTLNHNITQLITARFSFNQPISRTSVASVFFFGGINTADVAFSIAYENNDSVVLVSNSSPLQSFSRYSLGFSTALRSAASTQLADIQVVHIVSKLDSSNKFPLITDEALLTKVQEQTFKYFWDFGHPVSGLARERNTSNETVTSGGSGFGIMAIVSGIERGFITRQQGRERIQKIADFLTHTAQKFHGAFPHWLNGSTGVVVPFSAKDNGADLVETSFLMMGLLTARQYFNDAGAAETQLRTAINTLYQNVEWDWFRKGGEDKLYWHWSPNFNWEMNLPIQGWNECLITYVLAASSTTHSIPATVYNNGFTRNGSYVNGGLYYGYNLPLGEPMGGSLFFSHYSFMGINPNGLTDAYANYSTQTKNHSLINYSYCVANPKANLGYSADCWGLTASDIPNGYTASSPTNDVGVIAPTAALSSFPYTPAESMKALRFFYYVLGDKLWKEFGFVDAFSFSANWFANSFLAIDQGPIVVMIENYRSGLLWNLFTSCTEVKAGMRKLGFSAPYL
jgi:hypothetical protein